MNVWEGFFYGILGGALNEVVGLYKFRKFRILPSWFREKLYWQITISMIVVGGMLVCVYIKSDVELNPVLALNVGISAPLILDKIGTESLPSEPSDRIN